MFGEFKIEDLIHRARLREDLEGAGNRVNGVWIAWVRLPSGSTQKANTGGECRIDLGAPILVSVGSEPADLFSQSGIGLKGRFPSTKGAIVDRKALNRCLVAEVGSVDDSLSSLGG